MSDILREIKFSGLRSEIKDSKLVSDIDKKLNVAFSLVESGQSENGLKIVEFIRKVCWDQLNLGEYSKIDPTWRMVRVDESRLRVVHTKSILFMKSLSERGGSDIKRL